MSDQELREKLARAWAKQSLPEPYTDAARELVAEDFKAGWCAARANQAHDETLIQVIGERDQLARDFFTLKATHYKQAGEAQKELEKTKERLSRAIAVLSGMLETSYYGRCSIEYKYLKGVLKELEIG